MGKPLMRQIFLFPLLILLLMGCSESEKPNSKLFRNIYNNTFWEIDGEELISFSLGKLFFYTDQDVCFSYEEGTFEKIDYDGCVYNKVTYLMVSETETSFTIKEIVSSGKTPKGGNCSGGETTFTFTIINDKLLEWKIDYGNNDIDSGSLIRVNKSFNFKNCASGPSKAGLWG